MMDTDANGAQSSPESGRLYRNLDSSFQTQVKLDTTVSSDAGQPLGAQTVRSGPVILNSDLSNSVQEVSAVNDRFSLIDHYGTRGVLSFPVVTSVIGLRMEGDMNGFNIERAKRCEPKVFPV